MTSAEAKQPSDSGEPDPRPSLLIADDDEFMRTALSAQLKDSFRIVAVAGDAT
jgi:CheY-like chemotaxis protein